MPPFADPELVEGEPDAVRELVERSNGVPGPLLFSPPINRPPRQLSNADPFPTDLPLFEWP